MEVVQVTDFENTAANRGKKYSSPKEARDAKNERLRVAREARKAAGGSSAPGPKESLGPASAAAKATMHKIALSAGIMCAALVPATYRPEPGEINALCQPLERIALRHIPITHKVNEDVSDGLEILTVLGMYYTRIAGQAGNRQAPSQPAAPAGPTAPDASANGAVDPSAIDREWLASALAPVE